ncbi:unnamed protein product [Blepharisma stoltei]|uniref:BTB domain-containing protein n=1 Tax=Blepharisma stoltei TaxID=1481888 RepID=A0AAU9ITE5_9CILI|nr:unnamed protein product [Blepharisma stoltei]
MKWTKLPERQDDAPRVKNHTAIFYENSLYIYAGFDGTRHQNTLHALDLRNYNWTRPTTCGPTPLARNGHTATLYGSEVYVIGGWNGNLPYATEDIYVLNLKTMFWEKIIPYGEAMVACNMHSADLYEDKIYVFRGGDGSNYLNDLHSFDIPRRVWSKIDAHGNHPSARANHSSCIHNHHLYIFGGWNGIERLNDLYVLDLKSLIWSKPRTHGEIPCPRAGMSLNSLNGKIYLFGGSGVSSACYSDLYIFDPKTLLWSDVHTNQDTPTPRAGHSFTVISCHKLLLFGGSCGNQYPTTYYILDLDPPPQLQPIPPPEDLRLHIRSLFNNPSFSDIKFIVEGRAIYAHKVIITMLSEPFQGMFASGMRETREGSIEIKDISYRTFLILLKYLYTGEVEISAGTEGQSLSTESIIEIMHAADRYLIEPVIIACEHMLIERVTNENAEVIKGCVENIHADNIKSYCDWKIRYKNEF